MQILTSSSSSINKNDDEVAAIEPHFFFVHTWCAFDLYSRLSDTSSQQLQLVKNFAKSKSCNPKHLVQVGLEASQGARSNPEIAIFALNSSLASLLASSSPDYQVVALVLRNLISVGSVHKGNPDDESIMETYKQACRIMVGLKEGKYPSEEAKWLAMTAWNRAALPVKMGQVETAKKWMKMGLEVAIKVPGMDMYRSCMEEYFAGYEKKVSNGQSTAQA